MGPHEYMSGGEMPESPVSPAEQMAIGWHEGLTALVTAGFTRAEAFRLVLSQWDNYWDLAYQEMFENREAGGSQ